MGRGRGWRRDAPGSLPPPTHPPATSEAPGPALSPVGGGSRMLVEAEGAGRVPPQLGWQSPARCVRLLVQAPPPHPSPCSPGSASGALPWPGGRGQLRAAPDLPGRRLDRRTLGAEGSQVSRNRDCARRGSWTVFSSPQILCNQVLQPPTLREVVP